MKSIFIIIFSLILILLFVENSNSQTLIYSKIFPLESSVGVRCNILKSKDNNLFLTIASQHDYSNSAINILAVKMKSNGEVIWQTPLDKSDWAEVTDIFETNDGYYIVYPSKMKVGKYEHDILSTVKLDLDGKITNSNIDTSLKSSPYSPWFTKKIFEKLISFSTIHKSGTDYLVWLNYDLDCNFQNYDIIDSLKFPNLQYIFNSKINILNNGTISYSLSAVENDNTSPIYYRFFDKNKIRIKEIVVNQGNPIISPSYSGLIFETNNGDYILTGRTNTQSSGNSNFIKRVDNQGNLIWEDLISEGYYEFEKIIEDENGNIILAGNKFNKYDSTGIFSLNYFSLFCYTGVGKVKFKSVWGDSTIDNTLTDALYNNDGNILITGRLNKQPYLAQISYNTTSFTEIKSEANDLIISPNPVYDKLKLYSFNKFYNNRIEIYNIEGLKILEKPYQDEIDISMLSQGVYILKIGFKYQKFIKIK